jgi:uncharacterized membrane protein YdbT with pleckstrin-like domain
MPKYRFYPSVNDLVNGDEGLGGSFTIHRSLKSLFRQIAYFGLSLAALYIFEFGTIYFFGPTWRNKIPLVGQFTFRWFALVPISILVELVRCYYNDLYVLERERIVHHAGLLSWRYNVPSIRYYDIRAVQVSQGIIGRIFNFGDVELSTAAQDRSELVVIGIHAPREFCQVVEEMRSWHRSDNGIRDLARPEYTLRPSTELTRFSADR